MIKHVVMWKLKYEPNPDLRLINAYKMAFDLRALKNEIVQIKALKTGINTNPENEYHVILEMEFETMNDLAIYQKHPAHLRVVKFIRTIRELRACVDYEM